jgi:hypothetical protein
MENLKAQAETGFVAQPASATTSGELLVSRLHRARNTFALWLDRGIFACLCIIVAVTLQNAFAARWALRAALVLWVLRLPFVVPKKAEREPMILPLLIFISLAGVATFLSYAPLLSWDRMGWFTFLVVALLVAQNVKTLFQAKILVVLLLAAAMVSALRTGWQYVNGIGAELVTVAPDSLLYKDGLRSGDLIQLANHHPTRSLQQWKQALEATHNDRQLSLHVGRGAPVAYLDITIDRNDLEQWLAQPGTTVRRGRPLRAQGGLYHYIPYAGELLQLSLLTFGLLVMCAKGERLTQVVLAILFVALVAALVATVTRAYLAALLLGCTVELWLAHRKIRIPAAIALAVSLVVATVWVRSERGMGWLAINDPGTQYRLMMWKDSLRLVPQHPVFGVGPDSVMQYGDQWNIEAYKKLPLRSHFHSTYIQLAVDCGLPCLAAFVWLMAAYLMFLARSWKRALHWEWFPRGALLGILGGTIGFVLTAFIHYNLGDGEVMILVWLFMGLAMALARMERRDGRVNVVSSTPSS